MLSRMIHIRESFAVEPGPYQGTTFSRAVLPQNIENAPIWRNHNKPAAVAIVVPLGRTSN